MSDPFTSEVEKHVQVPFHDIYELMQRLGGDTLKAIQTLSNRQFELYRQRYRGILDGSVKYMDGWELNEDPWAREMATVQMALKELWQRRRLELREENWPARKPKGKGKREDQKGSGRGDRRIRIRGRDYLLYPESGRLRALEEQPRGEAVPA